MRTFTRLVSAAAVVPLWLATAGLASAIPASATSASAAPARVAAHPSVTGSGSSYAGVAIDTWAQAVRGSGLIVNYNPDGTAAGQADFIDGSDDFAVSDPAFRTSPDELAGLGRQVVPWSFSYLPAVAGGTAFPYHLTVHGHLIRNLRLSGRTLFEIFTGKITNWDDPQITRDYGSQLPSLPIIPVIHGELAGISYYFTRWMATEFPQQWNAFCEQVHPGIKLPCPPTEIYPQFGNAKMEVGSNNVASYIASSFGNGAIGYDEYLYPLADHEPVLALRNAAGDYVLPIAANVTTALTAATINEDPHSPHFLQENLNRVYVFKNPHSYPLSNYSYWIAPRTGGPLPPAFTKARGRTLSAVVVYALCGGQRHLAGLGYAPLPGNLVAGGLLEAGKIPGHGSVPTKCP
jgi:ABC-type phosphate transport system substrate-binding protein